MVVSGIWRLRLLGECVLSASDGAAISLSTRKSLALLAYLALQPGQRAPRERLASLLWEDAAPGQARLNLRKALSSLRQETRLKDRPEATLIEANNDAAWLVPGALATDVQAFEGALASDLTDPAVAAQVADLYAGDVLADFTIRGAPAFETWALVERQRLREQAIGALTRLMETSLESGAAPEVGVRAAMRVLALDPLQERAHRTLMRLHVRQGRRAAALKQFHTLSDQLARDLNTTPEAETRALFREISSARHAGASEAPADPPSANEAPAAEAPVFAPPRRSRRGLAMTAAALVALTAVGAGVAVVSGVDPIAALRPTPRDRSIAVLPFTTFGAEGETGLFADGLTEEVINSLAQYPDLKVSGRTSAFYFKGRNADLREVARKLGVAYVVEGSVRRDGDRLRVTAQLIEAEKGFHVWSATFDRSTTDAFAIQDEVARTVAGELKARLGSRPRVAAAPDGRTYQTYLVARAYLRNGDQAQLATARQLFERQLAIQPNDARALAGYAEATIGLARVFAMPFPEARRASEAAVARAISLDPQSAETWLARSQIEALIAARTNEPGHGTWAMEAAKRAVDLAPRSPEALASYGRSLVDLGQAEQAVAILERAVALDPLRRGAQAQLGQAYRAVGLTAKAAQQFRTTLSLFPDYSDVRILLGEVLYERGEVVAAERAFDGAFATSRSPLIAFRRSTLYANLQMRDEALAQLDSVRAPPMFAAGAQVRKLHLKRDYRGALALAEADAARDPASPLRSIVYADAAILGDNVKARRLLPELVPGLLTPQPDFPAAALDQALIGAHVLNHSGEQAQAQRVLARILLLAPPRPGRESLPLEWFARINAYAELGQTDRALAELRRAIDAGYHNRFDDSIFIPIEDWPSLQRLRGDARFQAMLAEIETRNGELRRTLLAARQKR